MHGRWEATGSHALGPHLLSCSTQGVRAHQALSKLDQSLPSRLLALQPLEAAAVAGQSCCAVQGYGGGGGGGSSQYESGYGRQSAGYDAGYEQGGGYGSQAGSKRDSTSAGNYSSYNQVRGQGASGHMGTALPSSAGCYSKGVLGLVQPGGCVS